MKTYHDEKLGFEMEVPDEWTVPVFGASHTPFGESVVFGCDYFEAFNLVIGLLEPVPPLAQTEDEFRQYVQRNNFASLEFGRLTVAGVEHVWARYYVGGGRWNKRYLVVLNKVEYAVTATCFYQNRLVEREQVWDAVVASFCPPEPPLAVPTPPAPEPKSSSVVGQILESMTSPVLPAPGPGLSPVAPSPGPLAAPQPEKTVPNADLTLAFSLLSYGLIALLALIFILARAGPNDLWSLSSASHTSLSDFEFDSILLVMFFGIGALECLGFGLGVAQNTRSPGSRGAFFDYVERAMQVRDRKNETLGEIVFSDYTRRSHGLLEALRILPQAFLHALSKIGTTLFTFGRLQPAVVVLFVAFVIVFGFILRLPLTVPGAALFFAILFYFCYQAFLTQTAKRKNLSRPDDIQKRPLVISDLALDSAIRTASQSSVTPELIHKILGQASVIAAIQEDLAKTDQIGSREIWRLGLIAPDGDSYDLRLSQLSFEERSKRLAKDVNVLQFFRNQIPYKRSAVLHTGVRVNSILVTGGAVKHLGYPGWNYPLDPKLKTVGFVRLRDIQMDGDSPFAKDRGRSFTKFLQEDGFPLKDSYPDGDPLTTEHGGTIVIENGMAAVIYPSYFVQRRLIDDSGNLLEIGLDEDFSQGIDGMKMQPSVSQRLFKYVETSKLIPIVRYRSFPYTSEFMLPLLDTPMSASGWADLYIDPRGKARLFIAKQKTLDEWYAMLEKLKQLLYAELAKKDYHLLGLTQDPVQMDRYLRQKQAILQDYFIIEDLRVPLDNSG